MKKTDTFHYCARCDKEIQGPRYGKLGKSGEYHFECLEPVENFNARKRKQVYN